MLQSSEKQTITTNKVRHQRSPFQCPLIYLPVKAPQEATLDSQVLLAASKMGAQKARAMRAGAGGFDIDEFVAKLVTFMGGKRSIGDDGEVDDGLDADDYLEWDLIGRKALAKSRRVPAMTFM